MAYLTPHQQKALLRVLAFAPDNFSPSNRAVRLFFDKTDRGIEPSSQELAADQIAYSELLLAHHFVSGTQRQMWLDSHLQGDYPLGLLVRDIYKEVLESTGIKRQKCVIVYREAAKLWMYMNPERKLGVLLAIPWNIGSTQLVEQVRRGREKD